MSNLTHSQINDEHIHKRAEKEEESSNKQQIWITNVWVVFLTILSSHKKERESYSDEIDRGTQQTLCFSSFCNYLLVNLIVLFAKQCVRVCVYYVL